MTSPLILSNKYRAQNKDMQILLSNSQAGPGRTVNQEQEEISRNHIHSTHLIYLSVSKNNTND